MDERGCISIVLSLCRVLSALHAATPPVIHRDIKPQNVILSPGGVCHLIDFGTVRQYKENEAQDTVYMGTRVSMPPEQFGYGQTDARSDIYSMGMLMRFLLTGGYESLPGATGSFGLRRAVECCTAFDPGKRFASVRALSRALRLLQHRRMGWGVGIALAIIAALALCILPRVESEARFTNPLLSRAVGYALGLPKGAAIPERRLAEVTELVVCGQNGESSAHEHEEIAWERHDVYQVTVPHGDIADLSELSQLVNLRVLVLDYQSIQDIESLRALPLEQVSLVGYRITDLSPLADITSLMILDVAQNPVEDASALAKLPRLAKLNLNATRVQSLDAFTDSSIQELYVCEAPITDYAPLSTWRNLQRLDAEYLDDAALKLVARLTGLKKLTLHHCGPFADFTLFAPLKGLRELDICSCSYGSLTGLEQLPGLVSLNLIDTQTSDIGPLADLPALSELELRNNEIADFAPLLAARHLRVLTLDEGQRALAEAQLEGARFSLEFYPS